MCGNHTITPSLARTVLGSPPRVREPLWADLFREIVHGITPACAGTTYIEYAKHPEYEDHPRVCGNHSPPFEWHLLSTGSPPRVREPRSRRGCR